MPHTTVTGMAYERLSLHESLDRAAQAVDYPRFRSEQEHTRTDGRLLGVGVACCIEPTAATGGSFAVEAANIRIEPSGDVNVFLGTGSHGQGTETTMAQVVADTLGVPIEQVSVRDGDTNSSPFGGGSAGSRTAVLAGGACHRAAGQLQKKLLTLSAHLLEAAPDDLAVEQGIISVRGTPSRFLPVADVARTAYHDPSALPADMEAGLEVTVRHASEGATYANATHVCLCEVDALTYKVRILRYVVVSDCGVLINPAIVEGQISGGVVQGIGGVLYEDFVYDTVGNPLCSTFMDYLLPTAAEVPEIEFVHIETPAANLGGYKGVGEGGAIASPPALINAIADALQIDLLTQPLSPSALYEQVQRGRGDVRPV